MESSKAQRPGNDWHFAIGALSAPDERLGPTTGGHGRKFVGGHAACWSMRGVVEVEAVEEGVEVVSSVGPVERCRGGVVAVLKADDAFGELAEV